MRKPLWTCLLAVAATAMLAVPAFAQAPIKIGVLTPLSPPGDSGAGQLIVRGAKMAADELNAQGGILGGRKIELVIEDDAGTPEKGVAGLRKLASQDKVAAVIGQFHSSVMEATQDLAEQLKVPIFSTQASAKKITEKHLAYTFRTHVIDPDRVQLWNKWITQQGFKRVAILAENTDYGIGLAEETKRQFASSNVKAELKSIIFDRAVVDLTPQVLEIKNWKPDLLINIGLGTQMYIIIKQAFDVGLIPATPMLISYDAPARAEYWKNVGEKGAYAAFVVYYHPTMKLTPRGEAFRNQLESELLRRRGRQGGEQPPQRRVEQRSESGRAPHASPSSRCRSLREAGGGRYLCISRGGCRANGATPPALVIRSPPRRVDGRARLARKGGEGNGTGTGTGDREVARQRRRSGIG